MNCIRTTVYQDSAGRQVLVTQWEDGTQEVATRDEPFGSWGPPLALVRTEQYEVKS